MAGWTRAVLLVPSMLAVAAAAHAQDVSSRCADCHLSRPDMPNARHVSDWDQSTHARAGVGCDACHRGNPNTHEPFLAHQGVLRSSNPASPVARGNLPATCGVCHQGPYAAFQRSHHHEMLRTGNTQVPTCATCHGEVASVLLSPRLLEGQCTACHGSGRIAPKPELPAEARLMVEGVRDARLLLNQADVFIARVRDAERRTALQADAARAAVPLTEATHAGHAFVFDGLRERLADARARISALYERLLTPDAP